MNMSGDELRSKVQAAKDKEATEKAQQEVRHAARLETIAKEVAVAKAAFSAGDFLAAEQHFDRALIHNP
eukprot:CAMPEP_0174745528 /NCGR_PEP_ID=MMETSP1094-20130205/86993_1 /TAXON_ID=156173 /ORGANISM="Chrysochromulina brevifilum, Strain UTEX LB 985" /LENGTH=68 /DNA_ID=CAMNT_0015950093 /DNA_START=1 /DNA_END=204 /DNA_ORIENTATION=-